jgi:glycosyltransferase involved in cell wall biosynthesis
MGDGPEKRKLEALAEKLKVHDKIIFFGYKNFDEYIKILKITDIFINPSYTEGLPTTVAEAALCKNAIIATNVGGTPEVITNEKSGFLIPPKNIPELKNKLEILISDKELRKQLGESAYSEVVNKFNWDKSIEKYIKIFDELV